MATNDADRPPPQPIAINRAYLNAWLVGAGPAPAEAEWDEANVSDVPSPSARNSRPPPRPAESTPEAPPVKHAG
jgi:hypothetical protein